jgi:hypothetical protein
MSTINLVDILNGTLLNTVGFTHRFSYHRERSNVVLQEDSLLMHHDSLSRNIVNVICSIGSIPHLEANNAVVGIVN